MRPVQIFSRTVTEPDSSTPKRNQVPRVIQMYWCRQLTCVCLCTVQDDYYGKKPREHKYTDDPQEYKYNDKPYKEGYDKPYMGLMLTTSTARTATVLKVPQVPQEPPACQVSLSIVWQARAAVCFRHKCTTDDDLVLEGGVQKGRCQWQACTALVVSLGPTPAAQQSLTVMPHGNLLGHRACDTVCDSAIVANRPSLSTSG